MRRSGCVGVILLLGLGILPAKLSAQQPGGGSSGNRGAPTSGIHQNYPNPFNPDTRWTFVIGPEVITSGGARVTVRILNVLQQLVAYPVAEGTGGSAPVLNNLVFTEPGEYTAYWDGRDRNNHQVASGLYYVQFIVNGRTINVKKSLVGK